MWLLRRFLQSNIFKIVKTLTRWWWFRAVFLKNLEEHLTVTFQLKHMNLEEPPFQHLTDPSHHAQGSDGFVCMETSHIFPWEQQTNVLTFSTTDVQSSSQKISSCQHTRLIHQLVYAAHTNTSTFTIHVSSAGGVGYTPPPSGKSNPTGDGCLGVGGM